MATTHTNGGVGGEERVRQTFKRAYDPTKEPPRPLHREIPEGEPYPVEALGQLGEQAATKINEATRAPMEICAQSSLAGMTLAVMGHVDIELPTGQIKPSCEYLATIAESGERKTSADNRALEAVREFEQECDQHYQEDYCHYKNKLEAWDKQRSQILNSAKKFPTKEAKAQGLEDLGHKPEAPISPMLTTGGDPTIEGLIRLLQEGGVPICGVFTDEGGQFVGGHAMADDHRLRTAGALSNLWDGQDLKRVRGGDGFFAIKGRRVAIHLLFQPLVAHRMFSDPILRDQGLLTRFLSVMPPRAAGTRQYVEVLDFSNLSNFSSRFRVLLDRPFSYRNPERPRDGLKPGVLTLGS
jgi:hypothetical protein